MAHPHFQKAPCSLHDQGKVTCNQFESNHQRLQFPQRNLNMMNSVRFLYVHMVAKELSSLETDTVESIQMHLLVLAGSPAATKVICFKNSQKSKSSSRKFLYSSNSIPLKNQELDQVRPRSLEDWSPSKKAHTLQQE
jgi:hypothetical protein